MSDLLELKDKTLIDMLLEEQQSIGTPVGRFADAAEFTQARTGKASHSDLIPLSAPRKGEQYAFKVDLDRCSGCKGCVTACHSLNGLDEDETWRDIGLLVGGNTVQPYQQTVTTACHHCVEPACLIGCPVNAYEKDEHSGIVLHLDDQCIGCQYCVLKCPYDVPKYNAKRGIVRKCDMCHSRLSVGEAPACVQACPHEAIRIETVDIEEALERSVAKDGLIQGSPDPSYTKPTTRYVSSKAIPENAQAADVHVLRPQHTHWPLVGLLALSQIGVGGFLASVLFSSFFEGPWKLGVLTMSWLVLHAGLLCSVLHLGQPLKAWRIFLGFRRSWLSREAVVLGICSAVASAALGLFAAGYVWPERFGMVSEQWSGFLCVLAAVSGLIGVLTSVYIYVDTRRSFWRFWVTGSKFYGSVALGALAFAALGSGGEAIFLGVLALSIVGKWMLEKRSSFENEQTSGMFAGPLLSFWRGRQLVGGLSLVAVLAAFWVSHLALLGIVLGLVMVGELGERVLFFKAVNAPKMPGSIER